MKSITLALLVFLLSFTAAFAQNVAHVPRITAGFSTGIVTGDARHSFPVSFGIEGRYEIPVTNSQLSVMVSGGFSLLPSDYYDNDYFGNQSGIYYNSGFHSLQAFLPVQVGARLYQKKLFFELNAGASFKLNDNSPSTSSVTPMISPALGYGFRFGSSQRYGIDLSLRYDARIEGNGGSSFNQVALHTAFSFGLK